MNIEGKKLTEGELVKLQIARITEQGFYLTAQNQQEIYMPRGEAKGNPAIADNVWVGIYLTNGTITATMKLEKVVLQHNKPAEGIKIGDLVIGMVYNLNDAGAFIITNEGYIGHIPRLDVVGRIAIGHKVEGRVTFVRDDGRLNLSMRPLKEISRVSDAEVILEFLRRNNGSMPYTDDTPPEVILDKFGISKRAFKRALGKLLKDGVIEQREGQTYLTQNSPI